jgi:glutathione synthase/RimK-type ligase-like ATP-grasp enzyme
VKRIILLGARDHGDKNSIHVIKSAIGPQLEHDAVVMTVHFEDVIFSIETGNVRIVDTKSQIDIADADLVVAVNWYKGGSLAIYRDVAYSIALYLESKAVPFWNREMIEQRSVSKLSAMTLFALHGIDVPKTYYSLDGMLLVKEVPALFPVVAKDAMASRGHRNYLLENADDLRHRVHVPAAPNRLLVQEAVPNDGDLRIVCFDNKPVFALQRRRNSDATHLNNTSQGGTAQIVELHHLPQNVIDTCTRICKLMGRDMAGIDILPATDGSGRFVYLEANAVPQLTSGAYVEQKLHAMAHALKEYVRGNT